MSLRQSTTLAIALTIGALVASGAPSFSFWRGHTPIDRWLGWTAMTALAGAAFAATRRLPRPERRISARGGSHITTAVLLVLLVDSLLEMVTGTTSGVPVEPATLTLLDKLSSTFRAPITEELIFRGGVFLALTAGMNSIPAHRFMPAVLTGSLFGLAHVPVGGWDVFVPTAIGGTTLAAAFILSGTIVAPILAHMIGNGVAVFEVPEIAMVVVGAWVGSVLIHGCAYRHDELKTVLRSVAG